MKRVKSRMRMVLVGGMVCAGVSSGQNQIGTGAVEALYRENCLACHGGRENVGIGGSLSDGIWNHGSSDEEVARSIRAGIPELGMEAFGETLSEDQIRSLVIYLRELERLEGREARSRRGPDEVIRSEHHDLRLEKVLEAPEPLWSVAFLPEGGLLLTGLNGTLWKAEGGELKTIAGVPKVWRHGQGGLLEVQLHPDYARNGWIYISYAASEDGHSGMTEVARGRIRDGRWEDHEVIFRAARELHRNAGVHFGSRMVLRDGYLFFSIGDRGRPEEAQSLAHPNGKIHRIHDDGRIPEDNPFAGRTDALPSIWSYGHRNPQGLDLDPGSGTLWSSEHGPRGGDEINQIRPGLNYGWPVITYGMNYNGRPITSLTAAPGMEQPVLQWTPSIAVCGIDFYEGDAFPRWKGNLLVGGLASKELHRLVIEEGKVLTDEVILRGRGRIRDVASAPDGHPWILVEEGSPRRGVIYRLIPAE